MEEGGVHLLQNFIPGNLSKVTRMPISPQNSLTHQTRSRFTTSSKSKCPSLRRRWILLKWPEGSDAEGLSAENDGPTPVHTISYAPGERFWENSRAAAPQKQSKMHIPRDALQDLMKRFPDLPKSLN